MDKNLQQKRLESANEFIKTIGSHGHHFFNYKGEFSSLEIDSRGRVWFIDSYSKKRVYTHYSHRWRGFTNGHTLKTLICRLRDFIKQGTRFNIPAFEHWAYDETGMSAVKNKAIQLDLLITK